MNITAKQAKRFWSRVQVGGDDECWLWTGCEMGHGYGSYKIGSQKAGTRQNTGAHRVACELVYGEIPPDKVVMHSCDVKRCCNPKHLSISTHSENHKDAWSKGLRRGAKFGVDEINKIRAASGSNGEIAAKFNTDCRYIWEIRTRRVWTHEAGLT